MMVFFLESPLRIGKATKDEHKVTSSAEEVTLLSFIRDRGVGFW